MSILVNGTELAQATRSSKLAARSTWATARSASISALCRRSGNSFEIVTNTSSSPITGTFNGLAEGAVFSEDGYQFQITYQGGTGGDSVVVTRVA